MISAHDWNKGRPITQCTNVPMIAAHDWYKHPMYQSWAEMIGTLVLWFMLCTNHGPKRLVHWYIGSSCAPIMGRNDWYIGTLVHWYVGTLVHWYVGTLVHWYIGTLVHWYIGTLVHWYIASSLVHAMSQSWAEMIGTLVPWCGWGYVPIMGRNDWDVGTLVRLGSCPNHGPK